MTRKVLIETDRREVMNCCLIEADRISDKEYPVVVKHEFQYDENGNMVPVKKTSYHSGTCIVCGAKITVTNEK